jgi:AraC family transcriptional regulator of adaptative response/methylated-DNA-[protein]-cysteine methyltransferase
MLPGISWGSLNQEQCWEAVCARDASQDGRFFYSVRTTGVYCRPGCASRQPRRENVGFHETIAAAEAAGFRPCKRCRPTEGSQAERHVAAVERACKLIRDSETLPSLAELAAAARISRYHFHRVFKQVTGATPRDWGKAHRLGRFADRLDAGEAIAEAAYGAGFSGSSRAYEAAGNGFGMTPGARRSGGKGETIRHTMVSTWLGWALVAATERGICMTALGDDRAALEADLRRRFPAAELAPADAVLADWAGRVVRFVTRPGDQIDLPLDIRGTAFQAQVWRALQKIPPGETATYTGIAQALGRPRAVRAVAQACATNKLAVLVPCHRVVRGDGDLAGYRWGIERKRALLAREREAAMADAAAPTSLLPRLRGREGRGPSPDAAAE